MAAKEPPSRDLRSLEELHRASLAVQVEVVTLWFSYTQLQQLQTHLQDRPTRRFCNNVLLHSFLLAARNLLAFLYPHYPRPSDIVAEDFFEDLDIWREGRLVPDPAMANGDLIGEISRRLAHLTWDRAETNKPLWGAFSIAWNIGRALQSFLTKVDLKNVAPQLREDIEIGMKQLQSERDRCGGENVTSAPAS